jgi:hypothetical protein
MLNTVGRFIYTQYWGILYVEHCWIIYLHKILGLLSVEHWEDLFTQNTKEYVLMNTAGRLFTQNTGIYIVLNTGKIYLHKILGNTFCLTLLEDLFTQNTGKYFMLNTVGRFIYTQYWGILYVEHCGKIYLHNISNNTFC